MLASRQPGSRKRLARLIDAMRSRGRELVASNGPLRDHLAGHKVRLLHMEYAETKGEDGSVRRLGQAHFFDYDRSMVVTATADLRTGEVLGIEDRRGVRPPPSQEEIAEARELAAADPDLRAAVRRTGVEVVAFAARSTMEGDPAATNRRLELHFWSGTKRPRRLASVVVDLTTRELLPFREDQEGQACPEQ